MDKRYKTPADPLDFKHITETKERSGTKYTKYTYDDSTPGRRPKKTRRQQPPGFDSHDTLMRTLTPYDWYIELGTRLLRERNAANYGAAELEEVAAQGLAPVSDPEEMDRLMCRTKPVAVVRDSADLKAALYNGRLVIEIDVRVHDAVLQRAIKAAIVGARARIPRPSRFSAWIKHRILALFDLRLQRRNLKEERTQLALWLFPEVKDSKARGHRFDRACKYLDAAIADLDSLRALRE